MHSPSACKNFTLSVLAILLSVVPASVNERVEESSHQLEEYVHILQVQQVALERGTHKIRKQGYVSQVEVQRSTGEARITRALYLLHVQLKFLD